MHALLASDAARAISALAACSAAALLMPSPSSSTRGLQAVAQPCHGRWKHWTAGDTLAMAGTLRGTWRP